MSSRAADKGALEALHDRLAKKLARALEGECDAATLNQVRQFLKDNDVKARPIEGSDLEKLGAAAAARGIDLGIEGEPGAAH